MTFPTTWRGSCFWSRSTAPTRSPPAQNITNRRQTMDNWNFTGRPDIPAWPQDEQGQKEKAVLLMQTFDSPADTDTVISLLSAYGIPASSITTGRAAQERSSTASPATAPACMCPSPGWRRRRSCCRLSRWRTRKRNNTPERSLSLCWITRRNTSAGWPATP